MGEIIKDPYSIENFSPGTVVAVNPGNRRTNEHFFALVLSTRETPNGTPPTSVIVSRLGFCSGNGFLPYLYFSKVSKLSLGAGTRSNQVHCYFFNPEKNRFVFIKSGERVKGCLSYVYGLYGKICYSTPAHRFYIPLHCRDDCGTYNLRLNF